MINPVFATPVITEDPAATTLPTKNVLVVPIPVTVVLAAIDEPRIFADNVISDVLAAETPVIVENPVIKSPVNTVPLTVVVPIPTDVAATPARVEKGL